MDEINKHINRVNFAAYFVIGWSFFMIFIIPFASKGLNITVDKTGFFLGIAEMLLLFVLSVGVTAKRYALLWPILIILLIDTIVASFILGISRPIAILFRLIAIGLVINGIRSATLLKDLSNFYKKSTNTFTPDSESEQKTYTYEQKESSTQKEKIRSDFDTNVEYYYYILNINSNSSIKEIKSAYISAIKKNHPDKYEHLGEEFIQFANIRTTVINEAMDYLRKINNFN